MRHLVPTLAALSCCAATWAVEADHDTTSDDIPHYDEVLISASRLDVELGGATISSIDSETIELSPALNLPELMSYQAGVQYRNLFGNTGGASASIDMRGFGAASVSNTLIMLNGRRLNDIDLAFVDLSSIPLEVIQRVEFIRGNAGAVLYGDGAVGGVINIITDHGYSETPSGTVQATAGSDDYLQGHVSYMQDIHDWSVMAFGSIRDGDGYRDNNEVEQQNMYADMRRWGERSDVYLTFSYHDQELGLPGGRIVDPGAGTNELEDDRRGAASPEDYADESGFGLSGGSTWRFADALTGIFDAGYQSKDQDSAFFSAFGDTFVETTLSTISLTPRMIYRPGEQWQSINGIDAYLADYESSRMAADGGPAYHDFTADQLTLAVYSQNTLRLREGSDLSFGLRLQHYDFSGKDDFDSTVIFFPDPPGELEDTDDDDTEWAAHIGLDQTINEEWTAFGRISRSFRLPTIDERVGSNPSFPFPADASFELDVQTSQDIEIGLRFEAERVQAQISAYLMQLEDELHFNSDSFTNVNLDDTQRQGLEAQGTWQAHEYWSLFAAVAYTQAEFTDGDYDGNDVPLVAPFTATVSAEWRPQPWLSSMLVIRHVDEKWMDNDQENEQTQIPDYTLVDFKVQGQYEGWKASLSVNNIFDEDYYTDAVASTFTPGRFSAFPLPGTTYMAAVSYSY